MKPQHSSDSSSFALTRVSLTWRFAIASLFLVLVFSGGLAYGLMHYLTDRIDEHALDDVKAEARDIVGRRLLKQLTPEEMSQPLSSERLDEFDAFVQGSILSPRTARVVVWNRNNQVIYSDDRSLLGKDMGPSHERAEAYAGETAAEIEGGGEDANVNARDGGKVVEVYVPVIFPGSTEIVGLFEVYQTYAPFAEQVGIMRNFVTIALLGGLGTLWVVLLAVVQYGARTISRQNRDLRQALIEQAEAEEARARLAAIIRSTTDLVATADSGRELLFLNSAGRTMLGVPRHEEVSGAQLIDLFAESDRQAILKEALPVAAREGSWTGETHLVARDGHAVPVSQVVLGHVSDKGALEYFSLIARDISERVRLERELTALAHHDALTGLANRRGFLDALEVELDAARFDSRSLAVLFMDLDGFKAVNDTGGHAAGDGLLVSIAHLLTAVTRNNDVLGRLGGDEFAVVIPGADQSDATSAAHRIAEAVGKHRYVVDGRAFAVSTSIGVALFPRDGANAEEVLLHADTAMYSAKRNHSGVVLYGQTNPAPETGWRQAAP